MTTDEDRLRDMLEYLAKVEDNRPAVLEDLEADEVLAAAIVRWIEIVGEAAANVSDPTREAHPEVPWREIVGMRNRLIHAYPDINLALVWGVVERDGPAMVASLRDILGDPS